MDLAALLPAVRAIAVAAGQGIMRHWRPGTGMAAQGKADGSPVTIADCEADALIVDRLRALTPDIPIVSEEGVGEGPPEAPGPVFWIVDPLDGTREFVAGRDEFTVNIGLVAGGRPVLGVIQVPAKGDVYWGAEGLGAFHARPGGGEAAIRVRPAPAGGLVVAASRSHRNAALEQLLASLPVRDQVIGGSSVKFCLVAAGIADLYPRTTPTSEWDTCAGDAILRAAGGSVTTLDGAPLAYGKPGLRNPPFMARGG